MNAQNPAIEPAPWFRHPWPWLLMSGKGMAVHPRPWRGPAVGV